MDYQTEPMDDLSSQPPDHLHTPNRKPGRSKKKLTIILSSVLVMLVAAGAAAVFLLKKDDSPARQTTNQQSQTEQEEEKPTLSPAEAAQPQTYKSEALNLEFTHRKDWTVTEVTEAKQVVVTSPKFSYQTSEGESAEGVFTLKFGLGASEDAQKTIGLAKAVRDSLVVAYDAPTESQRFYTNITYAGPDETAFGFFIVTGSVALKSGAPLAGSVVINDADYLIAGGFGADEANSLTFDGVDPADLEQYTAFEQAMAIVTSLKVF